MSLEAIKQRLNATDYELGWVVGTIEAEGCFVRNGHRRYFTLTSTDVECCLKLLQIMKMGKVRPHSPDHFDKHNYHHKAAYRWMVVRKKEVAILEWILEGKIIYREDFNLPKHKSLEASS